AHAVLARPVEVVVGFCALFLGGLDECLTGLRLVPGIGDRQRAAGAVVRAGAAGVVLRPPEVRHQVLVAPAGAAVLVLPGLEVVPVTADVDHRVDAAGPAEDLAARPVDGAAARAVLRDGQVVPVVRGLEQPVHRGGSADLVGVVGRTGFQQQDADARVGGQARRQDAAGAAGADDDVVIHGGLLRDKGNNTRCGVRGACGGSALSPVGPLTASP